MNYKNILPFAALAAMMFSSCEDQIMDWTKDPSKGEVTVAELPLELAEKIERYDALKTYTDFTLGVGIGLDLYMNDETYRNIANANFDEVTVGYAMKHAAMVESDGSIDFDPVDAFITKTKEAGLSTFGHTLVWHQNQNAAYLNNLIAATIIPGQAGTNIISNGDFEAGTLDPWGGWGNGSTREVSASGGGLGGSGYAMVLTNPTAANLWSAQQLYTFDAPLEQGKEYNCSFWVKASSSAVIQVELQSANYSANYSGGIDVGTTWTQVNLTFTPTAADRTRFIFDFGQSAATFYIDDVVFMEAPTNMVSNGDFETATLDPWGGWGNGSSRAVSADGEGFDGAGYAMVLTNPTAANLWSAQQVYWFDQALEQDKEYNLSFMVKATSSAAIQIQLQSDDYSANYYGGISVGTSWSQVQLTVTPSTATRTKLVIDFGQTAASYYFDDIVFTAEGGGSGPTIIEKTDEEKAEIIGDAMESWIGGMVDHYKADIHAWDVVNEPMKGSGDVRDGSDDYTAGEEPDDYFSWPLYLGKDYAVMAFNLARQYGNIDDKLFINDYNLESSPAKLQGLIDYVTYIEAQGATVDGIGTQMHISTSTDKDLIKQMFQKLADSGKLIKISELDIVVGTASPTADQLAAQADMYQYVIDQYREIIPSAQQYGVTIWGISDNEQEHEYWLSGDAPNLWDANYNRKHAYKGAADGLAGKDVSEDFSGELQY
ncbi:endo-1,4-beta-xylanase [Mangrovibacterium diazotrophicum]|nr:endo-1,4-beta-xylanase [Mangrovibacterium diazotrophicum]